MINVGNTGYNHQKMSDHAKDYNEILGVLTSEARRRGIYLLVNKGDPGYERPNRAAAFLEKAVLRYIGPGGVWKEAFDFSSETYHENLSRTGYRRELLSYLFKGDASLVTNSFRASSELL